MLLQNSGGFASNIKGLENEFIKALEKNVLESKNPKYCCEFVFNVPQANVEEHAKVVYDGDSYAEKHKMDYFLGKHHRRFK